MDAMRPTTHRYDHSYSLVRNPLNRYAINDRTQGLVRGRRGDITVNLSATSPASPDEASNWLPAPQGPFMVVLRVYAPTAAGVGPDGQVLYKPPMVRRSQARRP
jgi:hypothetical protein